MNKQVLFIQGAGKGAYKEDEKLVASLRLGLYNGTLRSASPIAGTTAVMSNSQNADLVTRDCIDQRIRKVLHYVPTSSSSAPWCTKCRMLQKPIDRLFKLSEEGLRKTGAACSR